MTNDLRQTVARIDLDALVETMCQARCYIPNVRWDDGMTEGIARIERMIAERQISTIIPLIEAAERERAERLAQALTAIWEGDVPRPLGKIYRNDGVRSKHDQCTHGVWMYDDCGACIAEFAAAAIRASNGDKR